MSIYRFYFYEENIFGRKKKKIFWSLDNYARSFRSPSYVKQKNSLKFYKEKFDFTLLRFTSIFVLPCDYLIIFNLETFFKHS